MEIGKRVTLVLRKEKITNFCGVSLPDGRLMKRLIEGTGYKYLGILQADQI